MSVTGITPEFPWLSASFPVFITDVKSTSLFHSFIIVPLYIIASILANTTTKLMYLPWINTDQLDMVFSLPHPSLALDNWIQLPYLWCSLRGHRSSLALSISDDFAHLPPDLPVPASWGPGVSSLVANQPSPLLFPCSVCLTLYSSLRHKFHNLAAEWGLPLSSLTWQRRIGLCSIFTSFFAWKNTWTFVDFSVVVSEPFLGWTEIIEFTLVAKIPKESTEKLKDKNKKFKWLSREPKILERRPVEYLPCSGPV